MHKQLFIDPFKTVEPARLLKFGLMFFVLLTVTGMLTGTRFNGVLDAHFVEKLFTVRTLTDNLVNVLSLIFVFWAIGRFMDPEVKLIHIFNAALICRLPFFAVAIFNTNGFISRLIALVTHNVTEGVYNFSWIETLLFLLFVIVAFTAIIYSVYLFYKGFKKAAIMNTTAHKLLFFAGILIAEVISKFILSNV